MVDGLMGGMSKLEWMNGCIDKWMYGSVCGAERIDVWGGWFWMGR